MPSPAPPKLVLLHAFPLDREMWKPQLAAFPDAVALDLPGFGQALPEENWGVDAAADRVAAAVEGRIVLGGLSMGGYVAMAFARRHPERVAGLIFADTRAEPDDPAGKQQRDRLIALTQEFGPSKVYEGLIPKLLCDETRAKRPEIAEEIRRIAAKQSAAGVVGGLKALRDRPDATAELTKVTAPTLILIGEHDAVTPVADGQALSYLVNGSKLVVIPKAGHLSNLENRTAFNAAMKDFVDSI